MNHIERFRAVCRGLPVDYVPILGLPGASGAAFGGAWGQVYDNLIKTGMPDFVKPWTFETQWDLDAAKPWSDFWGTLTPLTLNFFPADPPPGIKFNKRIDGQYEYLEYETGAVTKQMRDNDDKYYMPEFIQYHVRDRQSWELYKELNTPGNLWPAEKIDQACEPYLDRDRPLFLNLMSTWGKIRDIAGAEKACTMLYDSPDLVQDIIDWQTQIRRTYLYPLVEKLKPEIIKLGEDNCYNHGMLISPAHFQQFCSPVYKEIADLARANKAEMVVVDTDGKVEQLLPLLDECGVNATYPVEAKADNNLLELRGQYPDFIFLGWVEKEIANEGNEHLMEPEFENKIIPMLKKGRYFPNADHSLQPMCTFPNLCKFMDLLHKATANPEGQFYSYLETRTHHV